ncbi:uncharacterized protein FOMMEDRAFT_168774 [Fomitiporia mediterranea MF3/22]|uniref:uncharacterized protein n=1 Tax=Fomitiporia mediterranea (strain MF3/22) TaxID=694068 RepID=UPI0004408B83|nr:uncharacterized protein FOMMEDRAFT_168774 [Fomitiporia mediterranea MF3/22]EJD02276.1 hypothetical protein FOMMEDRAFT_168774 [Fomitiporia mediterranea MF3/22]
MDPRVQVLSNVVLAVRDAREVIHHASASHIVRYSRLFVSTILALPSLSSGHPLVRFAAFSLLLVLTSAIALSYNYSDSNSATAATTDNTEVEGPARRALSKFLMPTSSIWPERYLYIIRSADQQQQSRNGKRISLQLGTFLRDIKQGIIELRNPEIDLPLLLKGQLCTDGWNIELNMSFKDRSMAWAWVISDEISCFPDEVYSIRSNAQPRPFTFAEGGMAPVDWTVLKRYCTLFYENLDDIIVWPSLDCVPHAFIQRCIRSIQHDLRMAFGAQRTSVFSFATAEIGLSVFDDAFVFASLPFSRIPSRVSNRKGTQHAPRSCAPLFNRLSEVLSLLTSGPHPLRVLSLSNASASYTTALETHASSLEYDAVTRRECIKSLGVQGWREERLYTRLEAAGLRAGVVMKWVVLLEVED